MLGCWLVTGLHHSSIVCCWWMNEWLLNYASFVVYRHIYSYLQPAAKLLFTDHWHWAVGIVAPSCGHAHGLQFTPPNLRYSRVQLSHNVIPIQCKIPMSRPVGLLFQVRYFDHRWQALYNYINAIKRRPLWMKTKVNPSRPRARRISRAYPKRPIGYFRSRYHNDGISQRMNVGIHVGSS